MSSNIARSIYTGKGVCKPKIINFGAWSLAHNSGLTERSQARSNNLVETPYGQLIQHRNYIDKPVEKIKYPEELENPCLGVSSGNRAVLHVIRPQKTRRKYLSSVSGKNGNECIRAEFHDAIKPGNEKALEQGYVAPAQTDSGHHDASSCLARVDSSINISPLESVENTTVQLRSLESDKTHQNFVGGLMDSATLATNSNRPQLKLNYNEFVSLSKQNKNNLDASNKKKIKKKLKSDWYPAFFGARVPESNSRIGRRYSQCSEGLASENKTKSETYFHPVTPRELRSDRIHVIGMGPIGQYIAHNISRLDHAPPVILLMHRPLMMQQWHDEGAAIQIYRGDKIITQSGFHIESSATFRRTYPGQRFVGFGENLEHTSEPPSYDIDTLIVTTDSSKTIAALHSIKHRIRSTTTVCLIHDGIGIVHKLNMLIFTEPLQRPTFVLGFLSHKLVATENVFTHIQKGPSEFYCSKLPRLTITQPKNGVAVERVDFSWSPEARHLVGTLLRIPELNTLTLGHKDFHKKHLSRVVVGAVIEPLAAAFDCCNNELLHNFGVTQIMRVLVQEISRIVTSLPELRNIKNVEECFSPDSLEKKIITCIHNSKSVVSPMVTNVRAGKKTEIDFFTGYMIERARELEIPCPVNQMIYNLVRGKETMIRRSNENYIPFP